MQTRASALRGLAAGSRAKQGDSGIAERRWEQPRSKNRIRLSTKRPAANPVVLYAEDSLVDGVDAPSSSTKNRKTGVKKMKNGKAASPPVVVNDALREKGMKIAQQLAGFYPQPPIPLKHRNKFELLVAVMLSAQVLRSRPFTPLYPFLQWFCSSGQQSAMDLHRTVDRYCRDARAVFRCSKSCDRESVFAAKHAREPCSPALVQINVLDATQKRVDFAPQC